MISPRVIELPRRLEPVSRDTFLGAAEAEAPRHLAYVGNVVALRRRDGEGPGRGRGGDRPGSPGTPAAA